MSPRVLVVDDSPTIRKLVELAFRPTGFELEYAATGQDGVRRAREQAPDVILLDFVLPDMRGIDVCAQLAQIESTRKTPIVVMSAKEELRTLFAPYAAVADILPKPFSSEQLVASVRKIVDVDATQSRFSQAQKEAAAAVLYACLKKPFAFIPSWCAQMGASPAAPFFARKMLTAEVVGQLLEALAPTFREALREPTSNASAKAETPRAPSVENRGRRPALAGELEGWPVSDVLTMVGASGRTGVLRLSGGLSGGVSSGTASVDTLVYFRSGEIVLVTSTRHDPSGKPEVILEAERGVSSNGGARDLVQALHEAGRKQLLDVLDQGSHRTSHPTSQRFGFEELAALPDYVEAYGRHMSMGRKTLLFPAPSDREATPAQSLSGLGLDHVRHRVEGARELWPDASVVFDRVAGFSTKVKGIAFDADERRVLALVDGRWSLQGIATRAAVSLEVARRVAWCLAEIGLVAPVSSKSDARPVLIVEPDVEGFQRQLESMLAKRPDPVPLVSVASVVDVAEVARRARPSLVIVNAGGEGGVATKAARALRDDVALEGVSLVAILDLTAGNRRAELTAAGFDAVLVKPVDYADLERLIRH